MKAKFKNLLSAIGKNRVIFIIVRGVRLLWKILSHNLGLKVLSLVMAVLLWNYVVSSNTSITRTKTLTGLTGYISGQTNLSTYDLAMLDNPTEKLGNISVQIEVPQAEYAYPSSDNVQVTLDLTSVRAAGTREVRLKASTSYGRVVRIIPDTITLTFEALDSRQIPINAQIGGTQSDNYWYNIVRCNPSTLTVSGAASVVQNIARANVVVDVTDADSSFIAPVKYVLLDENGEEITQPMLNRSSSSISVSVDVYPMREIPIATDPAKVLTGQPAQGYVVESVTVQPQTIAVAADAELLESIEEMQIEPISIEGASQSFSTRAGVSTLSGFKSVSADEVYVTVTIAEESVGAWIEDVNVSFVNKGENLTLDSEAQTVRVYVTGPRSAVEALKQEGFTGTIDLSGYGAGAYDLAIAFPTDAYPNVTFTPEKAEMHVTLQEAANEPTGGN